MIVSPVRCPHCQATLRSAKPVPGGTRLKCPKCAKAFVVPPDGALAAEGFTALPPRAGSAPSLPASSAAGHDMQPEVALAQARKTRALVAVLAGTGIFLFLGGALLLFCL